ncbi:MAG: methyltransferase domain-containing protein [bacterium]|nr:methyltransferase domain-containing protein [bacterium]
MTEYLTDRFDLNRPELVSALDEVSLWSAMFGLLLLKHLRLKPNMRVLDVGCGTGFPLLELAQRLGPSSTVVGIDPWDAALNRARRKAVARKIRNVEIQQGDGAALPFADGEFDLVVSNIGVNNFDDPEAVLAECRRVSRPSAGIVLTTNVRGHMEELYDVFASTLKELDLTARLGSLQDHVDHRLTVDRISEMLEKAGFRVVRVFRETFPMRFTDGSAMFRHSFMKIGFLDGWRSVLAPAEAAEVFLRLENNLNRLAAAQGALELTIPAAYLEGEKMMTN